MNKKNIPVIVQLKQNNNLIIQGINQNDAGVLFDMKVMDGLEAFDFSGYSVVTLKIKKPDGTFTVDSDGGARVDVVNPKKGRLKLNIPTSCTAQNGMHFCKIGFSFQDSTLFETTSFNYFVGANPTPDDEDVIGTDEFPVLSNLIAEVSGAIGAEELRSYAESNRVEAEELRVSRDVNMIALLVDMLGAIDEASQTAIGMLDDVLQALAEGASVDVSQLATLASKTYVKQETRYLDFSINPDTQTKDTQLIIYNRPDASMPNLDLGELGYATDTHKLYIGNSNNVDGELPNTLVNEPCHVIGSTEPTDTSKLWIDTSGTAPIIKYYDGSTWVACNTAVFA